MRSNSSRPRPRRHRPLRFEPLEDRLTLSASIGSLNQSLPTNLAPMKRPVGSSVPFGLTPAQVRAAYGFSNVSFGNIAGDGTGQTIAIVDAFNDPTIVSDLATFDRTFGLPDPPNFQIVKQHSGKKYPKDNAGWAQEIALDVEWAHAIAPGASILLVEARTAAGFGTAIDYARHVPGVSVVSLSAAGSEFKSERATDPLFTTPYGHAGVTFVVASGDEGARPEYPSSSPNVLSVGGSTLSLGWNGQWYRGNETVWSGGGGGLSQFEGTPSFQSGFGLATRGTPDVAYDANPNTGFAVFDSYGSGGWAEFGGTSAGTPQWAALVAIADQGRALNGMGPLANAQAALYAVSRSDFFDITSGSNSAPATTGYDLATGLGSPIADLLIPDLATYTGSTNFTVAALPPPPPKHGKLKASSISAHAVEFVSTAGNTVSSTVGTAVSADSLASAWAEHDKPTLAPLSIANDSVATTAVPTIAKATSFTSTPTSRRHRTRRETATAAFKSPDDATLPGIDAFFTNFPVAA
jgi:subtilase family serine protease